MAERMCRMTASPLFLLCLITVGLVVQSRELKGRGLQWGTALHAHTLRTAQEALRMNPGTSRSAFESSLTAISHDSFQEDKKFCRVMGACRIGDGTFLLPRWMKTYSTHITKCGISKVQYNIVDAERGHEHEPLVLQGMKVPITLKDNYKRFDVIGGEPPRGERSLLASDLTPSFLLLDLFRRPGAYGGKTKVLCTTKKGSVCRTENASDATSFNPMILVDSRVSDTKDFLWPKSLLRLLRNAADGMLEIADLRDVYGWKVRSEASCFRSLITTNVKIADIPSDAFLPDNLLFSMNTLNRKPIGRDKAPGVHCSSKVLILNRYGKRFIEGSDKLSQAISLFGSELRQRHRHILVEPEVVYFENSSFHEQVSVMQESNIVVASHGHGNANFMFLRPESQIFEILPFGFQSDLYRNISRAYGSKYSSVTAQPDIEVFLACLQHFNAHESEEKSAFIREWQAAAAAFTNQTVAQKKNVKSEYSVPEDEEDSSDQVLRRLTQCASHQRISVDVKDLARKVVSIAAKQCHVDWQPNQR